MKTTLKEKLPTVPRKPGVYQFIGPGEKVLYVGKAKDLRARLRSYFRGGMDSPKSMLDPRKSMLDPRKSKMMRSVRDFTFLVTENELEALVLEANLIKQFRPRYNVVLRDDKAYPYIKLTVDEKWPALKVVRRIKRDGALYFGPYTPAGSMWEAIRFIRRNFGVRPCRHGLEKPMRPCVQYQMGRCLAPCAGLVDRDEYLAEVQEVRRFLAGERRGLVDELKGRMAELSGDEKYEEAAAVRDKIASLERIWESQRVVSAELGDLDALGCITSGPDAAFQVFFVRGGVMVGARDFVLRGKADMPLGELTHEFVEVFYSKEIIPPPEVVLRKLPEGADQLSKWLTRKRGARCRVRTPGRKKKYKELIEMAEHNAAEALSGRRAADAASDAVLAELAQRLSLKRPPESIGAFDVSNISGAEPAGSFVYWAEGGFRKELYRHLKVRTVKGADDYAMMAEIVKRTLKAIGDDMPSLVLIDGGKGQLEAARKAIKDVINRPPLLAGLAKRPDRLFVRGRPGPLDLEDRSPSSLLLKRVRDEAHRFALGYHRKLRSKRMLESRIEKVPGIGKKTRLSLLKKFGSAGAVGRAALEEIMEVPGVGPKTAQKLKDSLKE